MSRHQKPLVLVPHVRQAWEGDEEVLVCARYGAIKGTDESVRDKGVAARDYNRAKFKSDFHAAARIVKDAVGNNGNILDNLVDKVMPFLERNADVICVAPHPSFDDEDGADYDVVSRPFPTNALPLAYANYIAESLGTGVDEEILQRERVGRTKLNHLQRFLWQPSFVGGVRREAAYILVDDVVTFGGTLAALRSHIVRGGGYVAAVTSLAHRSGRHLKLAIRSETWNQLVALFGGDLDGFWKLEVGHGARCLTEAEALRLIKWAGEEGNGRSGRALLQQLRTCLLEVATNRRQSRGAKSGG